MFLRVGTLKHPLSFSLKETLILPISLYSSYNPLFTTSPFEKLNPEWHWIQFNLLKKRSIPLNSDLESEDVEF